MIPWFSFQHSFRGFFFEHGSIFGINFWKFDFGFVVNVLVSQSLGYGCFCLNLYFFVSKELSSRPSRMGPLSGRVSKTSSMSGLGQGLMTSILASSRLHINILLKVFSMCMESILTFPVFQSIFGLYCFCYGMALASYIIRT